MMYTLTTMKKTAISTIILSVILFSSHLVVHAQTATCSPINENNFGQCCVDSNDGGAACNDFIPGSSSSTTPAAATSNLIATTGECASTITTQNQWDDCCDNVGASNQAPQSACDTFANNQNSVCSTAITNQIQYDDCCGNGGGAGQATAPSCRTYETANNMSAGNNGTATTFVPGNGSNSPNASAAAVNQALNIHLQNPLSGVSTIPDAINKILSVVIRVALPLIIIMFIWSGLTFIMARGNPTEIGKAKNIFLYTVIGTLLILGAWVITNAIIGTVNAIIS